MVCSQLPAKPNFLLERAVEKSLIASTSRGSKMKYLLKVLRKNSGCKHFL
jgi:hypothetical protein